MSEAGRIRELLDEARRIERAVPRQMDPASALRERDEQSRKAHGLRCEASALAALLLVERLGALPPIPDGVRWQ